MSPKNTCACMEKFTGGKTSRTNTSVSSEWLDALIISSSTNLGRTKDFWSNRVEIFSATRSSTSKYCNQNSVVVFQIGVE